MADGEARWLLMVIRDTTATEAQVKAERQNQELVRVVQMLSRDRTGFIEFKEEMDRLLDITAAPDLSFDALKGVVHTLKGNAAIFGFLSFAERCHALESRMAAEGEIPQDAAEALGQAWRQALDTIEVFVSDASQDLVHVESDDFNALVQGIRTNLSRKELLRMLRQWRNVPARRRMERIGRQVERIAEDLGKPVRVEIDDHRVRIPEEFLKHFWPSLVHVVRNAVDHGIEAPDERNAGGKEATGHVRVTAELVDDFVLRIEDDGRGIDWQKIRERAQQQGLGAASDLDLVHALFTPGLSTRDQASEISGRGIGTAEVRAQAEQAGGTVSVESSCGNGSAFVFRFPAPGSGFTQDLKPA